MISISVIIPVFNAGKYLEESLDSVLAQTLEGIEIICVDDGSVDDSPAILARYAALHGNIRVFNQPNKGAGLARNLALDNARGKYVAFLDSDDLYPDPGALKFLYDLAESSGCQAAGGYERLFVDGGNSGRSERYTNNWLDRNRYPRFGTIDFKEYQSPLGYQRYIFSRELLDANGIRFKDLYPYEDPPFCARALHCAGKICVSDRTVYKYRRENQARDWMGKGGILARHFLEGRLLTLRFAHENDYAKMFALVAVNLHSVLPPEAYELQDVKPIYDEINRFVESLGLKTVAFVFGDLSQGGIQRVMSHLVPQFVMNWYRVVLLTTNGREKDVYSVDVPVERVVLGADQVPETRSCRLRAALAGCHVDFAIFQEYYISWLRSDMATAKSCGVRCIVHHHNMFSNFFLRHYMAVDELDLYRLFAEASAMIVLSRADEYYFRVMGCNAHYFPNPVEDVPAGFRRSPEGKTVLWMARYSAVKRPVDALKIFERVLRRHPDARMKMLGGFTGSKDVETVSAQIKEYLLGNPVLAAAVSLEGFQGDVWKYLRGASALLTTAKFEGFPCTLAEAAAAGVPTVGYELPYLEMAADNPGFVQTPQGDVAAAADAVCRLFEDETFAARASASARAAFERVRGFDQMQAYGRLFADIDKGVRATCADDMPGMVLRMTVLHGLTGLAELKDQIAAREEDILRQKAELNAKADRRDGWLAAEKAKAARAEEKLSTAQAKLEAAKAQVARRDEWLAAEKAKTVQAEEKLSAAQAKLEAEKAKVVRRDEWLAAEKAKTVRVEKKFDAAQAKLEAAKAQVARRDEWLAAEKAKNERAEAKLAEERGKVSRRDKWLEKEKVGNEKLQARVESQERLLAARDAELRSKDAELARLRKSAETLAAIRTVAG